MEPTPMPRNPAEIINSIVANLSMASRMCDQTSRAVRLADGDGEYDAGQAQAFREAIALIRVEAKDLLEAQS